MIIAYWYFLIGLMIGCLITYVLANKLGFEYLFDDYKRWAEDDEFKLELSFDKFKKIVCVLLPVMVAFTWPYFVYLTAKKYFR